MALVERVLTDSTPGDSALGWLQEARRELDVAAPTLRKRRGTVEWAESRLRVELARVRVLEARRQPNASTLATALAAVDSAEARFFCPDLACGPRDRHSLEHLEEARTRLDSLLQSRRKP
jgi:hypothetical protein